MVEARLSHLVMEVSSHALDQKRVFGLPFQSAVFTNLSQDHLDYHANLDAYAEAKLSLFRPLERSSWAVVNQDDLLFAKIKKETSARLLSYGLREKAMLRPQARPASSRPCLSGTTRRGKMVISGLSHRALLLLGSSRASFPGKLIGTFGF